MATPNIIFAGSMTGKTDAFALSTGESTLVNNAAGSGQNFKINLLSVCNDDSAAVTLTLTYYSQDDRGGTGFPIASAFSIPANSTVVIVGQGGRIYLDEDRSLGALASADNALTVLVSYEIIAT